MEKIFRIVDKLYHLAIATLVFILVFQLAKLNRTVEIGIAEGHNTSSTTDVVESVDYEVYYPTTQTTTTSELTTENEVVEEIEEVEEVEETSDIRKFRVTAYCSCPKCCGEWAYGRDKDENGDEIVLGASGQRLVSGVSAAGTLPFGTKVNLDGFGEVVIQDRFAKWIVDKYGKDVIDLYFINHDEAVEWGVKYLEGEVLYD